MTRPNFASLLAIALPLWGCAESAIAPQAPTYLSEYSPGRNAYGVDGAVTADQLGYVRGLSWPQARQDMIKALGFPAHFDEYRDFYRAPQGGWIVIHYRGPEAVGFSEE